MARQPYNLIYPGVIESYDPWSNQNHTMLVTDRMEGESSVGVSRRKPSGWLPPTTYSFSKWNVDYQKGWQRWKFTHAPHNGGLSVTTGVLGAPQGAKIHGPGHFDEAMTEGEAFASPDALRDSALIKARVALKQGSVNLGVAWAERSMTARLIGDTTTKLAKSFVHLSKGRTRAAMTTLGISGSRREPRGNSVPKKWLELQYGWKPLVSDCYGAVEALSKQPPSGWRVTAKGRAAEQKSRRAFREMDLYGYSDGCNCTAQVERRVYARIDALPANEALISLASLGITNPLLILWERMPYSFVVDWFLPVGAWIESFDAMLGYESGYYSSSFYAKAQWVDDYHGKVEYPAWMSNAGVFEQKYLGRKMVLVVDRDVSDSVPLPTMPRLKNPASLGHMANGLALLTQAFGRR